MEIGDASTLCLSGRVGAVVPADNEREGIKSAFMFADFVHTLERCMFRARKKSRHAKINRLGCIGLEGTLSQNERG